MHKVLIISILLFIPIKQLFSQLPKSETAPFSIKWRKVVSPNFNVFFEKSMDSVANYTINYLENNQKKIKQNPDDKVRKTNIILHGQNSVSNAFVTSSPRRSEFYANARPESGHFLHNNNWINLLVDHEYRHIVQRELAYNEMFNRTIHYLFGQSFASAFSRFTMPTWYWEGDAVDYETRESNYGRGRVPKFTLTSKMNVHSGNELNYDKQILGSYKDKTPSLYESGYLMVKYLKDNYGVEVFNKMVNSVNREPYLPLPFYRALKNETGLNYKELYAKSVESLRKKGFAEEKKSLNIRKNNNYFDFKYPTELQSGGIATIRQGLGGYKEIHLINKDGENKKLIVPGRVNDFERIPSSKNTIGWIEFDKDPRWDKRTYSVIKIFDTEEKIIISKSKKNFYSSFDISPSGEKIVALNNRIKGSQVLCLYDKYFSGETRINLTGGTFSQIKFIDENRVLGIKTLKGVKTIFSFNIAEEKTTNIKSTRENIGWPTLEGEWLIYGSQKDEVEEIFFYNTSSNKTYILPGNPYGRYYPSVSLDGTEVLYSQMTRFGFDIQSTKINMSDLKEVDTSEEVEQNVSKIEVKNYEIKKLNPFLHFIRPVNWGVTDYGFDSKGVEYLTLGLESRNLFGTLVFNGGYKIDTRDKKHKRFFGVSLQALYPIIDFSISGSKDYYYQDLILNNAQGVPVDTIENADINFTAKDMTIGVRVPLSFTKGRYYTYLTIKSDYTNSNYYNYYTKSLSKISAEVPLSIERKRNYYGGLVYFSRRHKMSKRNVYTPYEQTLILESRKTTNDSDYDGSYFRSDFYLAFPGLSKNHSLRGKFRYEKQKHINYSFRRNIDFIYGYKNNFLFNEFSGWGIEYENPLAYPEIGLGPLFYIQRIRLISFVNSGNVIGLVNSPLGEVRESPLSFGFEIKLDMNFFRQSSVFDFGIRYSYVTKTIEKTKPSTIEITLGSISF
mgnify:FL=1